MKDFDKIFSDRLNEEGSFPNQGKNWDKLSGRLDVAAGALATAKALLWWKIAAIGLLAVSQDVGRPSKIGKQIPLNKKTPGWNKLWLSWKTGWQSNSPR